MRSRRRIISLLPALVLLACYHDMNASNPAGPSASTSSADLGDVVQLKIGDSVALNNSAVKVKFDRVSDDSRCPVGVTCVWEGDAVVHMTVTVSSSKADVELHANPSFAQTASYRGYNVRLTSLAPMPRENQPVAPDAYIASIVVSAS